MTNLFYRVCKFPPPDSFSTLLCEKNMDCELLQVSATDSDDGENGRVTYRIENRAETHSDWFDIEPETGT